MEPITYTSLPAHMQGAMSRYIEDGIGPGSFLTAVLSNDLMRAVFSADDDNRATLHAYALWLRWNAPSDSFGAPERVAAWIKTGGLNGMAAHAERVA